MKNIILISESQSILLTSIKEQLEELSYQVTAIPADVDAAHQLKLSANAYFLYVDELLLEKKQALIFLRDKAVEEDIPVFLIGNEDELARIEEIIPKHTIQHAFHRPINVKDVVKDIDASIKKNDKGQMKKILVVDDSGAMLRNVKGWLGERYQVVLANSGAMAIKYLALDRPDLVLLDYEMPVVDGKQVLEMIRTETEFSDVPVIFLTSKGDRESVMKVMALKPEGYLLKTMPPAEIIQAVDDFFEKKKRL